MRIIFTAVFIFLYTYGFSQQQSETDFPRDINKNEFSINAFNLVSFGAIDVAYERILNQNSSWALEGFILALDRNNEDVEFFFSKDASLTGKYKYFFGDRTAWGFYINGLAMLSTGKNYDYFESGDSYYSGPAEENYTDFALGFGLGGKFVAKKGFFLDLSTGIGRNLLTTQSPTIVFQFNVNLGHRF